MQHDCFASITGKNPVQNTEKYREIRTRLMKIRIGFKTFYIKRILINWWKILVDEYVFNIFDFKMRVFGWTEEPNKWSNRMNDQDCLGFLRYGDTDPA